LGITDLLWPQNSCSNLGSNESLEIEFTNFGNGSLFDFNLEVHINESWFDTLLQVSAIIPPDSSLSISFPLNLDLSDTGSYNFKAYLHYFGDLIPQNDSLKQTIHNYPLPQIFITNLDTAYCQSNNAHVALTGFPTGGYFTGNNVLNNAFYPAVTGFSTIQYFYSDNETGCNNNITEIVEVLESPQIDLGSDQIACQGDTVILEVSAGFAFYQWSNGLGNNNQAQVLYPDNYGLTVTAQNSCTAIDEILVSFNPLPIIQIQGDSAACMGDSVMLDAGFGFDFYAWQTEPAIYSQQVYVHESGVYPVIVSLDNCSSTDSFYVDFLPLPDIEISGKDTACQGESVKLDAGPGYGFYQWSNSMNNWDQTTTVYQTGYYWVRVSGENNCMGIDSIYVQFFPYPEIEFEPTSFLCSGDTVLLNPGKADEYLWSTGETTNEIYALESGNYSLTITSNKCSNSEAVYLTFFAAPDLSFLYEKQFHRVEFTNTSTIEDSYRWFFGDNYNSRLFEPSHVYPDTGSYVVQLESINDCGYSLVSDTIKITDVDKGFSFKKPTYFPNPGNGIFRISFSLYESL
ncbi:MAG: PKD domain-containing protein, partial [Bacteroidota bacterium]|nr:PKD domain-containing protein [Bacteroidota bacterium]